VLPQTKSVVETRAAIAGFVNNGQDTMQAAFRNNGNSGEASHIVAGLDYDHMHMETGSYAKVNGTHAVLGFVKDYGRTSWGPFVEAGWGTYSTHLDSGIRADGHAKYYGLGAYGKTNFDKGLYLEGSIRSGRASYNYRSNDLVNVAGHTVNTSYDAHNAYYGAHVGFGKVQSYHNNYKGNMYAKVFYNHQNGASATLNGVGLGETYKFDSVNSLRTRLGYRMTRDLAHGSFWYAGLAYEYEFLGDANATVKGLSTLTPSLGGAIGLVETGYTYGTANDSFGAGINLEGWFGKKRGAIVGGSAHWKF
jgi:outer membrane autotransporter barrel domain protein